MGVVVGHDDRSSVAGQDLLDHFMWVDARRVDGAAKQLLEADHAVMDVEG